MEPGNFGIKPRVQWSLCKMGMEIIKGVEMGHSKNFKSLNFKT